jgi:hypothetical protein
MNMHAMVQLPEHIVADRLASLVIRIEEIPDTNGGAYFYFLEDGRRCVVQFSDYERYRSRGIRLDVDAADHCTPKHAGDAYFFFQKAHGHLVAYCSGELALEMLKTAPVRFEKRSHAPYKSLLLEE